MTVVAIRITNTAVVSDLTAHTATPRADGRWQLSWLGGAVDRGQAVTGMVLAETVAKLQRQGRGTLADLPRQVLLDIEHWAGELGLSGPQALVLASQAPLGVGSDAAGTASRVAAAVTAGVDQPVGVGAEGAVSDADA